MLDKGVTIKIILTIVILFVSLIITSVFSIHRSRLKKHFKVEHNSIIKKMFIILIWVLAIILTITVWGYQFQSVWVIMSSLLALIAVGFIAVWSLLSNIIAGIIIYVSKPFEVGDLIEFPTESKVKGRIENIGLMFTTLAGSDYEINLPNNIMFQKLIKIKKKH